MRTSSLGRLAAFLLVLLGLTTLADTGTEAAYVASTDNSGSTLSAYPDWRAPVIARAAVVKAEGGIPGYVRPSGTYTVIASVADDSSSNPPAGLGTVTGNVSAITAGSTAVAMPASASTFMGLTYTHRSAALTVPAGRAATTYSANSIAANDLAVPSNAATPFTFSIVVDNTAPVRTSATIANGNIAGRIDAGDTITYLWNDVIDPQSVIAGWTGTSTPVTVQVQNAGGQNGDTVTIRSADNTTQLNLGTIRMKIADYVNANTIFGGPTNPQRSTMVWNSTTGAITVTFGPPDAAGTVITTGTQTSNHEWTPATGPYDRAGNPSTNVTVVTEGTPLDRDF